MAYYDEDGIEISDADIELSEEVLRTKTVPVVIDGVRSEVPISALITGHQKSGAADRRLQEATELLANHRQAIEIGNNFRKAATGDTDALRAAAVSLGLSADQVDDNLAGLTGDGSMGGAGLPTQTVSPPQFSTEEAAELRGLMHNLRTSGHSVADVGNIVSTSIRQQGAVNLRSQVHSAAMNDPKMRAFMEASTKKEALVDFIEAKLVKHLNETGSRLSPNALAAVVQETTAGFQAIGLQDTPASIDVPLLSVGPMAGPGEVPEEGNDKARENRVPTTSGEAYERNLQKRITDDLRAQAAAAQS